MKSSAKKNKILMISVRSDIGGGPKHLFDLARTIQSLHNTEISIAAPLAGFYTPKFESIAEHFLTIPHRRFSIFDFFKLLYFIKTHHYNIVHSHGRGAGIYSRLMGLFGIKVIHTFHGVHFKNDHFISKIKLLIDQILSHLTDKFICVSNEEKELAINMKLSPIERTNVVLNGVDTKSFYDSALKFIEDKKESSYIHFGYLARFNFQKGLDILVDYIQRFKNSYPDKIFTIKVAGTGEDFELIKNKILKLNLENRISLIGEITNPSVFLGEIDWYISFARWEGLPLSVLEAMASLKPCLLSDVVGNKDLAKNAEAILFNLKQYEDFEEKLLSILDRKIDRDLLIKKANLMLEKKHSLKLMAEQTYKVYQ